MSDYNERHLLGLAQATRNWVQVEGADEWLEAESAVTEGEVFEGRTYSRTFVHLKDGTMLRGHILDQHARGSDYYCTLRLA